MKILFICGSLEPGKDGVGDYTCKLAMELRRQGHLTSALALNDHHIAEEYISADGGYKGLPVLRLPSIWSIKKRFRHAKHWINDFDPEWVSFQFVSFSFHPKGLPYGMEKLLQRLGSGRCWEIMFHELWVGMNREASVKDTLWGWAQCFLIRRILKGIAPRVIHTQSQLHKAQLDALGYAVNFLPLFSNMPLADPFDVPKPYDDSSRITMVIFGSVHRGAPVSEFAHEVASYGRKYNRPVSLCLIGRCGPWQTEWVEEFMSVGIAVDNLGEQPANVISNVLAMATIGISTTPFCLIEKSGAVASMLQHNLNVVCVARPWTPRCHVDLHLPLGINEYKVGRFEQIMECPSGIATGYGVNEVADRFINELSEESRRSGRWSDKYATTIY